MSNWYEVYECECGKWWLDTPYRPPLTDGPFDTEDKAYDRHDEYLDALEVVDL